MLLKSALGPFWIPASPAANTSNSIPVVGSATTGPCVLLKVESPVAAPWPGIGLPTFVQVAPSSVERWTWISELLPGSWYETQTFLPFEVIHCRSAPAVSSTTVLHADAAAPAAQFVTE